MKRYWVSWYSGNYADEGCTTPPFKFWVTAYVDRNDDSGRDDCTLCAVIDAEDKESVWKLIGKHFPDYKRRFCDEKDFGWNPGDRFK